MTAQEYVNIATPIVHEIWKDAGADEWPMWGDSFKGE